MAKRWKQRLAGIVTKLRGTGYLGSLVAQMHREHAFPGSSWESHTDLLRRTIPDLERLTIVDFGCGPLGGLAKIFGERVISFDPYVPKFSQPPWDKKFDVIFSSDVLEHLTVGQFDDLLGRIAACRPIWAFLVVSTRKAHKTLPNGANAHITVKPAEWWYDRLRDGLPEYDAVLAESDLLHKEATFCMRRRDAAPSSPAVGSR